MTTTVLRKAGQKRPPVQASRLFGTQLKTAILVLLALLGESYPRELARLLGATLSNVQQAVDALEVEGVLSSRLLGGARRTSINPRFFAARELHALLERLAQADPLYVKIAASIRRRPRRAHKTV